MIYFMNTILLVQALLLFATSSFVFEVEIKVTIRNLGLVRRCVLSMYGTLHNTGLPVASPLQ